MEQIKLSRAISPKELIGMKFKSMGFEGDWLYHLGNAAKEGSWFIYGPSGNGKTNYALQLAKYLCKYSRVAYNSIEQGKSSTLQAAFVRLGMAEVDTRLVLLNRESLLELRQRLMKHKSPDIVFIDSWQTFRYDLEGARSVSYADYRRLIQDFPRKLFVIISKAKQSQPWNDTANNIKFDSNIKIWVENYFAQIETTRYEFGGQNFDIWPER